MRQNNYGDSIGPIGFSQCLGVCVCVCYLTYVPRYIFRERSSQGECTLKKLNYGTLAKTSFSLLCHFDVEKCFFVQGRLPT